MLGSIFGGKPKESWSDRTKAHRAALKAEQEVGSNASGGSRKSAAKDESSKKSPRTRKSGGQGFGRRSAD